MCAFGIETTGAKDRYCDGRERKTCAIDAAVAVLFCSLTCKIVNVLVCFSLRWKKNNNSMISLQKRRMNLTAANTFRFIEIDKEWVQNDGFESIIVHSFLCLCIVNHVALLRRTSDSLKQFDRCDWRIKNKNHKIYQLPYCRLEYNTKNCAQVFSRSATLLSCSQFQLLLQRRNNVQQKVFIKSVYVVCASSIEPNKSFTIVNQQLNYLLTSCYDFMFWNQ